MTLETVIIIKVLFILLVLAGVNRLLHEVHIRQLLKRFPLVKSDFLRQTQKNQIAENNQEIHELNKEYEYLDLKINKVASDLSKNNEDIESVRSEINKLTVLIEEMRNKDNG